MVNAVGKARRVTRNGREYVVVPMTSVVPGVLNGSKGPLYYPPDETARDVKQWDDTPIVVYHPTDKATGKPLSASHPGVLEESGIGFLRNSRYVDSLKHDGWFDVQKTEAYDRKLVAEGKPAILPHLLSGKAIELSTGLFTDNVQSPPDYKDHKGNPYSGMIARNYRRDHLAVLPDQRGACSLNDGCGVNNAANASLWDTFVANAAECTLNAEGVCINCGGKGGTKGRCKGGAGGSKPSKSGKPSTYDKMVSDTVARHEHQAAHHGAIAASHLERMQEIRKQLHEYGVHDPRDLSPGTNNPRYGNTAKLRMKSLAAEHAAADAEHTHHTSMQEQHRKTATSYRTPTGNATTGAVVDCTINAANDAKSADDRKFHLDEAATHSRQADVHGKRIEQMDAARKAKPTTNEGTTVTKPQLIDALIANGTFKADDKAKLEAFDEPTLNALAEKTKPAPAVTTNCGKPQTMSEMLKNATPEEQATWNTALRIEKNERTRLIGILTANTADAAKKANATKRYESLATDALEDLVNALPPVTNGADARTPFANQPAIYAPSVMPTVPVQNTYDGMKTPLKPFVSDDDIAAIDLANNHRYAARKTG